MVSRSLTSSFYFSRPPLKHLKCKLCSSASLAQKESPFHPLVCIPVTAEGSDSGSYMVKMLNSYFVFPPESKSGSENGHPELLWHRTRLMLSQVLKVREDCQPRWELDTKITAGFF